MARRRMVEVQIRSPIGVSSLLERKGSQLTLVVLFPFPAGGEGDRGWGYLDTP
jgi:hypothetical protein